jgi:hypothetical protein
MGMQCMLMLIMMLTLMLMSVRQQHPVKIDAKAAVAMATRAAADANKFWEEILPILSLFSRIHLTIEIHFSQLSLSFC